MYRIEFVGIGLNYSEYCVLYYTFASSSSPDIVFRLIRAGCVCVSAGMRLYNSSSSLEYEHKLILILQCAWLDTPGMGAQQRKSKGNFLCSLVKNLKLCKLESKENVCETHKKLVARARRPPHQPWIFRLTHSWKNASSLATTRTHILVLSASTAAENISLDFSNMCIIYFIKRQSRAVRKENCVFEKFCFIFSDDMSRRAHSSRTYIDISRAPTTIWQYKLGGSYFKLTSSSSCAGVAMPQNQEEEFCQQLVALSILSWLCEIQTHK